MPSSNLACAPRILNLLWEIRQQSPAPLRVLDVGPGWGKYGVLIREYVDPDTHIEAVELWAPYITPRLEAIYDRVVEGDVCDLDLEDFDVVLMVDVLEHIPKTPAVNLLDRIPGWVVVCTPRDFFHNGPNLPPPEEHVSHWTLPEFEGMGRYQDHAPLELETLGALIVRLKPTGAP